MTISVSAGVSGVARGGANIASPRDRETDEACAAQDQRTETLSQGLARHRTTLDELRERPSTLDRFEPTA